MTALDITCRVCLAQPGSHCLVDPFVGGIDHPERMEDAAAMTRVADPVSKQEFDRAVEESIGDVL